ncbi:MAG: cysteine hydrolase family protein [Gammaproteobacteria bacterium]|nr:cysteine hydrolase family protein [Gammaproteobacteria bacterium]
MTHVFWDVDTQVDFIDPGGKLYVAGSETIRANLARLTTFAHDRGIRIVASSDCHELADEELSNDPNFADTFPPHCMKGSPGQARIPETQLRDVLVVEPDTDLAEALALLEGHAGDILFHKRYFDVFTNPCVTPFVGALGLTQVTLYGVALDVCNRYAVEGLLAHHSNIAVTVVTDAVRAIDEQRRDELLAAWKARGVTLTTTAEATQITT